MIVKVRLDPAPGTPIADAFTEAVVAARVLNSYPGASFNGPVELDFAGTIFPVAPEDEPAKLVERWFLTRDARKERAENPERSRFERLPSGAVVTAPAKETT